MYFVSQMMWPCGLVSADHHLAGVHLFLHLSGLRARWDFPKMPKGGELTALFDGRFCLTGGVVWYARPLDCRAYACARL